MAIALLLAAVVAAVPTPSPSPSPSPSPPPTIGTVNVVTGSPQSLHRAAQAASVIDTRLLRNSTAPSIDQALRVLPGVDRNRSNAPFTNYGQLRLSFAGAGADRGELFVDGIPAQDGFGGQVDWNVYPGTSIVRGELLRGPGSALYGSGAIGGVLSLSTLAPSRRPGAILDAAAGGVERADTTFGSTGAIGSFASAVTLGTRRIAYNVIPRGQTTKVDRTAISTADVAHVRLRHTSERSAFDIDALASDDAQQDGRPNYGFSRSLRQAAVTWTQGAAATLALTAFGRSTTIVNLADMTTKPGALLYTQHVPTSDVGMRARWDRPVAGGGAYTIVAERRLVTGNSDQIAFNGVTQANVAGTQRLDGLALQRTWDGRLGAIAGIRYDTIATHAITARHDAALSPRVDLRYEASPAVVFRGAYGTGLRAPYLNELIRSFRIGTILQQNNPELVPERSRSAQLGLDLVSRNARFALDYTGTRVTDAIGFKTISPTVQQRSNFGRTATDAFTAEYDRGTLCTRFRTFAVSQHDRVTGGSPAQIGKRLAYVPDSAAAIDVERTVRALTGALEISYSGPTFADDLERQPLGSAVLIGGRLSLRAADGTTISLAVDNLADKVYLTSIDRLGAPSSVTLRVSLPLGPRVTVPLSVCG